MKKFNVFLLFFILFILGIIRANAQEDTTLQNIKEDTTLVTPLDSNLSTILDTSISSFVSGIIAEVNKRSALIDNIVSEGEIAIKTKDIDNSGSIDIKLKKKDDVWFKITGPLGINIAEAHFGRKKFVFYNARADEVITGSTTIINIGTLAKVRCTFDDMVNVFSGTVRIPKGKSDSLSYEEEGNKYVLILKRGTITRKYWVEKSTYSVHKYAYYGKTGALLIEFDFSEHTSYGEGSYANKVEVRRPSKGEYFTLKFETVNLNQPYINFKVDYPSDVTHKNWH